MTVYKCLKSKDILAYLKILLNLNMHIGITTNLQSNDYSNVLRIPYVKSKIFTARVFGVASPRLWNKLPLYIKKSHNIRLFKKTSKNLFENYNK